VEGDIVIVQEDQFCSDQKYGKYTFVWFSFLRQLVQLLDRLSIQIAWYGYLKKYILAKITCSKYK
jgi:hypothetical protein